MQSKLLIIIPAYNEAENIERVVDDLIQNYPQYDYLIINDGSRDATREICRRKGYRFVDLPINVGLTDGVQTGMMYAYRHGYDYALQFDGDGQHDPRYIADMLGSQRRIRMSRVLSRLQFVFCKLMPGRNNQSFLHKLHGFIGARRVF